MPAMKISQCITQATVVTRCYCSCRVAVLRIKATCMARNFLFPQAEAAKSLARIALKQLNITSERKVYKFHITHPTFLILNHSHDLKHTRSSTRFRLRKDEQPSATIKEGSIARKKILTTLPRTILAEGVPKSSKSPKRAASATKFAVVSKEALRKGEVLLERPVRLKGLYPPSHVYSHVIISREFSLTLIRKRTM